MKKITAIVRAEKLEVLKDALFAADVRGMTINQGAGLRRTAWLEGIRARQRVACQHDSQGTVHPYLCR